MTRRERARHASRAAILACAMATSAPAFAADDVEAARKTFVEAYADERAGRFEDALVKLAQVRSVRDTASVRFRIGACEEALGHFVEARESYLGVEAVARPDDREVAATAKAKAIELEAKIGSLALRVEGVSTGSARVDGRPLALRDGQASVFLAPGDHRVAYAPEGQEEAVTPITIEAGKKTILVLDRRGARAGEPGPPVERPAPRRTDPPPRAAPSTLGIVATVAGGVLVAASVVSLALRESAIGTIEDTCPDGRCPRSREADVESAKSRANVLLPIGVATGAVGVLAIGSGIYLLVRPSPVTVGAPLSGMTVGLGGGF